MQHHPRLLFVWAVVCLAVVAALARAANGMLDAGLPAMPAAAYILPDQASTPVPKSGSYTVRSGDTLSEIAERFEVTTTALIEANRLADPDNLRIGQRLRIPSLAALAEGGAAAPVPEQRGAPSERLPERAQGIESGSPLYRNTWVTYYGRPEVPILGILGEYGIDDLVPLLREQARVYDEGNGPDLGVTPAFHLIYGMATTRDGPGNSHLTYLEDDVVHGYVDRAAWEGMGVILDVQIGNLTPLESIKPAFAFLKYNNVQLALDPEFAMTTPGQEIPGQPPGAITAGQVNDVQTAMIEYMQQAGLAGHKVLVVHQFLPSMILDKDDIQELPGVDVVVCADGFGAPWPKISKYNAFMAENTQFAGFKLFYRWDEPIMTERQALGVDQVPGIGYMDVTPSLIIYQ